jgi:hypothetical protein
MNRRTFLWGLTLGALAPSRAAEAQLPTKMRHIGILSNKASDASEILLSHRKYDEAWELGFQLFRYMKWYERPMLTPAERLEIEAAQEENWEHLTADETGPYVQRLNEAYRSAGERVLREGRDRSFLNRCPRCGRIPRTPRARQCRWCHHDWHEAAGHL